MSHREAPEAQQEEETLRAELLGLRQRLVECERNEKGAWSGFEAVLDSITEGVQILDAELRYLYLNAAAAAHGRRRPEELIGRSFAEAYPGVDSTEVFARMQECVQDRMSHRMENSFAFPDGTSAWFELRIIPVPQGVLVLSLDIGARKRLEQQLAHSQKMEAIGRLAGAVAHDFNNLLTIIGSYSAFVEEALGGGHPAREDLRQVQHATQRAGELTQQLLSLSARRPVHADSVSVNEALRALEPMIKRLVGERIELCVELPEEALHACIDLGHLDQVMLNLAANARDAMPDGGKLSIAANREVMDDASAEAHVGAVPGEYARVTVSDTGCGMSREHMDRIFEPFFTTKGPGLGTGLGLATSHGLVRQAGGHIWVYSELGHGTTFKVYLPLASQTRRRVRKAAPVPVELHGTETVVVVDDDAPVRRLCARALKDHGYTVFEAENAEEAERFAERYSGIIHAVVTDLIMPGASGPELARRIADARPQTRFLFMSGYADPGRVQQVEAHRYLEKPFTPELLARKLRALLNRPDSGSAV